MKKFFLLSALLLLSIILSAQTFGNWKTFSETDPFEGSFKAILTTGSGGEFPYQNPKMVINWFENSEMVNIYFTDAGYAGCGGLKIQIVFDSDATIHDFYSYTNKDEDAWFFPTSNIDELYLKMKKHKTMHVRLVSDCGTKRFQISLMGFTRAFNWIFPEYEIQIANKENQKITHTVISDIVAKEFDEHIYYTEYKDFDNLCAVTTFSIDYLLRKKDVEHVLNELLIKNKETFKEYSPAYLDSEGNWIFSWEEIKVPNVRVMFKFTPLETLEVILYYK